MTILLWLYSYLTIDNQSLLKKTFGDRIYFVGLQGSYGRGEATEASDIDLVVILDKLTVDDIKIYSNMIDTLPSGAVI